MGEKQIKERGPLKNTQGPANAIRIGRFKASIEILFITAGIVLFSKTLTASTITWERLCVGLILFSSGLMAAILPYAQKAPSFRKLLVTVSGLMAGLWFFSLFRFAEVVIWPMARTNNIFYYGAMAYSHFVFALTMMVAVLWVMWGTSLIDSENSIPLRVFNWGNWHTFGGNSLSYTILIVTAIATWLWACAYTITLSLHPTEAQGAIRFLFWGIALTKALMTGATEEVVYRGLLQSVAVERYGLLGGILFQTAIYTVFHMNLGPAIQPQPFFLGVLLLIGLVFGMVTQLTKGIGWACTVHVALDVMVEWGNLS